MLSGLAPRPCARFVAPDHGLLESLREYSAGTSRKCGGSVGVRLFPHPGGGGGGVVQLIIVKVGEVKRFYAQELSHIMDEEVINDSFPSLKELENKIGRKMPESLLMWFRDAADCDDVRRSREERQLSSGLSDSFSEKISTLKQEMVSRNR